MMNASGSTPAPREHRVWTGIAEGSPVEAFARVCASHRPRLTTFGGFLAVAVAVMLVPPLAFAQSRGASYFLPDLTRAASSAALVPVSNLVLAFFGLGTTLVTLIVTDGRGGSDTDTVAITVRTPSHRDFNADGNPDLLFEGEDGARYVWFMNGTAFSSGSYLNTNQKDSSRSIVGTSDFTGDGQPDLLMQDWNDGTVHLYP
jgi:hypothetical protein